ncbi:hypothetical protein FS837_005433 [Tulasnella sp. UAMH 9824]|nr:hypothetical protein FS837_005433 [Tulasnella sp. UAMH 9824]
MSNDICPLLVQQRLAERRERQLTASLLKEQEAILLDVNRDINRLEDQVKKLLADRNAILHRLAVNRSLLAPIRSLPAEVLGMIFFEYASDPDNRFPHLLAFVCRRWRDAMYGTPAAWSFLYLAPNNADYPLEVHLGYLKRVGRCPLSVIVDLRNTRDFNDSLDWAEWLSDCLWSHPLSRFEITDMEDGTLFEALVPFIELLSDEKTRNRISAFLIHFECAPDRIGTTAVSAASQALAATSKLTNLSVPLEILQPSHSMLKQLIHLRLLLCYHDLVRLGPILQQCPLLESLTLGNCFPRSQSSPVTLPNLIDLCVSSADSLPRIFNTLRTPKLRKLTLDSIEGTSPEVGDGIKAFVRQGGSNTQPRPPPLTHLTLNEVNCPERTLVWMLGRVDTLQVLRIKENVKVRTLLINALVETPGPRKGWFCPRLKVIELDECKNLRESDIRTLITARPLVGEAQWRWGYLQRLTVNGKEYPSGQN